MSKTKPAATPDHAFDTGGHTDTGAAIAASPAANDDRDPATPGMPAAGGGRRGAARPANDDGVSIVALGAALAAAVNDNGTADPEPPLPGAYAVVPPSDWPVDHPHVVRLVAEATAVLADPASDANERRVALALVATAGGRGRLPAYAGKPAILAFRRRHGLPSGSMIAGRKSRALFDRFAPRFLLEVVDSTAETRSGSFFRAARNNVVSKMRGYVDSCIEGNVGVPANGRGGFSIEGVAVALGEMPSRLRWNVPARAVLRGALAAGLVELGDEFVPDPGLTEAEHGARVAALKAFWDGFDVPGGKVPESPLRRGYVDWQHAAALSGETDPAVLDDRSVRGHAMDTAVRRGVMLPGLMTRVDNLAALRTWGLDQIANESRGKASSSAIVSNHKAVFDRIVREAAMTLEDEATVLFEAETFDAALDRALAGFDNPRSAANFRRAAVRWSGLHAARVGAAELPDSLPDAVDALLGTRGATQAAVAEELGVKPSAVRDLILGSQSLSHSGWKMVIGMEGLFELVPGTLTSKAGRTPPRPTISSATHDYRALPRRMRPLLPPEATGWSGERLAAAAAKVAPLLSGSTSYGRMLKAGIARGENLPAFRPNERLSRELDAFRAYKEAPVSYPMARARGARWKSVLSGDMGMKELALPFRYALGPLDGGTAAGLGIDPDLQTMAWAAHAPFALGLFAQRSLRNADVPNGKGGTRGRVYTVSERHLAAQLLSMTNPVSGWLTQRPDLAEELVALDARLPAGHDDLLRHFGGGDGALILSADDVALARRDWPAFVGRAHDIYAQVVDHLDDVLEISRDPFQPIRGIVEDPEPQAALLRAIFDAERYWADDRTSPLLHRLDVRNSVMMRVAAITAFRPGNLVGSTFRADGLGKIRKVDGRWEISIDRREFKNFRNSRLFGTATSPMDYHKVLRDEAGLYRLLDRYFYEILPELRTGREGDAAFVARLGDPVTSKGWYDIVRNFGRRHIAHNPVLQSGIPGVTSFNPYSLRHVRASDVLRNGTSANRVEEAAFALQTSEGMIQRHYGFLLPNAASASGADTFDPAARLAWKK
jgi:hypothetical protein